VPAKAQILPKIFPTKFQQQTGISAAGARAMTKTNDTKQNVLPKPDQVCPAKSTLLREERDAGCTAAGARGLKPLRAKRPALRRIGSTDDGPRLMLKLENKSGQSCGGWRGRCERQEISEFYLFATKSRTDLPCHSGLTSSPTNGQRSPGQNIVPLTM
jgi:hypothetical protein